MYIPYDASHQEPYTKAYYKQVNGVWYVYSRVDSEPLHWIIAKATKEDCLINLRTNNNAHHNQPVE